MFRGGQIDLRTHDVWLKVNGRVVQLRDALELRRLPAGDQTIVVTPSGSTPPVATAFTSDGELQPGYLRKVTSAARALGSGHLDTPLGDLEVQQRRKFVDRQINRLAASSGVSNDQRMALTNKFRSTVSDLALTRGTDAVNAAVEAMISSTSVGSVQAAVRKLSELPTLADLAGAQPSFGMARPVGVGEATPALAALAVQAGQPPALPLKVNLAAMTSVSGHAIARWLERVDGVIDDEIVEQTRRSFPQLMGRDTSPLDVLVKTCKDRGLDANRLDAVRSILATLVSGTGENAPIVTSRPVAKFGAENDRFHVDVVYAGRSLELTLRADKVVTLPNGQKHVQVQVTTVLDRAHTMTARDMFVDPNVTAELRAEWSERTQIRLVTVIGKI